MLTQSGFFQVGFYNKQCTELAGDFLDTGSEVRHAARSDCHVVTIIEHIRGWHHTDEVFWLSAVCFTIVCRQLDYKRGVLASVGLQAMPQQHLSGFKRQGYAGMLAS